MTETVSGIFDGAFGGRTPTVSQAAAVAFVARYFVSLVAAAVPVFAFWLWLLSRRARRNFAEHVVLALYTGGVQVLAFMLLGPGVATSAAPDSSAGLIPQWALLTYVGGIIVMGLRDMVVFLAAAVWLLVVQGNYKSVEKIFLVASVAPLVFGDSVQNYEQHRWGRHICGKKKSRVSSLTWTPTDKNADGIGCASVGITSHEGRP